MARGPLTESRGPIHFEALPDIIDVLDITGGARVSFRPDGGAIAFVGASEGGLNTAYVRDMDDPEPRAVWGTWSLGWRFAQMVEA